MIGRVEHKIDEINAALPEGMRIGGLRDRAVQERFFHATDGLAARIADRALAAAQKDGSLDAIIRKWDDRYGGVE